jgi:hypothetical protein
MPTQAEALAALKEQISKEKVACFDHLKMLCDNSELLKHSGFKSVEEATNYFIKGSANTIEKLIRKFEKDYPDD